MSTRPTRVLLLIQALTQGGSERQLTATAVGLDRKRFATHVAVMREGGLRAAELQEARIPITVFRFTSFIRCWIPQAFSLWRFLRKNRFDIVHCFDTPSNLFAIAPARAAGVPVVLASQRAHRELSPHWRQIGLRFCDRLSHGIVVNCKFLKRHMVEDEGVSEDKVHLCYNGLDPRIFYRKGPRVVLPFPPGAVVIGTVCALRPEKNLPLLVDAFTRLAPQWPELHLLIVGSGPVLPELKEMVAVAGFGNRVHFEASVTETAAWLRALDIFVLPSRSEAFSNSIMEAMACGAVPVVSAVGGNTELVSDGRGLVFESGNCSQLVECLLTLLRDPPLRAVLIEEASRWVTTSLTAAEMAETMGLIYDSHFRRS